MYFCLLLSKNEGSVLSKWVQICVSLCFVRDFVEQTSAWITNLTEVTNYGLGEREEGLHKL